MDYVLLFCRSCLDGPIPFNPDEAAEVRWVRLEDTDARLENEPGSFSAWFAQAYRLFRAFIK